MTNTVIITGWHSGPNPSPGLGVAKSIRLAFPSVRIVAVDYSMRSTGLYDDVVDEIVALPPWSDVEPRATANELLSIARNYDAVLISTLDLETSLLASLRSKEGGWRLLVPTIDAVQLTEKPAMWAASKLSLAVPLTVSIEDVELLNRLIALHGWPLIVKGRRYESFWVPLLTSWTRRRSGWLQHGQSLHSYKSLWKAANTR